MGPSQIVASQGVPGHGIRGGQTLIVDAGGVVPSYFHAAPGSAIRLENGGVVGNELQVEDATVDVFGGSLGTGFNAFGATTINVYGGSIGDDFDVYGGATLNLFGSAFYIDEEPVSATSNERVIVSQRNVRLSGILSDGTEFHAYLYDNPVNNEWTIAPGATLTLTFMTVPEPTGTLLLAIVCFFGAIRRRW